MKRCPKCDQYYSDASLNYCLADGTQLAEVNSEATVVIPRDRGKKGSKLLLWLGLAVLVIAVSGISLAAILVWSLSGPDPSVPMNTANSRNSQSSKPASSPSPTISPTPTTGDENQSVEEETPSTNVDVEDPNEEPTPIGWDTTAGGFKGETGKTYTFLCPSNGTAFYGVFGSDVYTDFSSICNAAVHTGAITLEKGGIVTIEYRPGRPIYGSTERNGIKTHTTGEARRSFVIVNPAKQPKS